MVPLLMLHSSGKNLRDVLPQESANELMHAIQEASRANLLTACRFKANRKREEREYEARITPITEEELIASIHDRTAEQWVPNVGTDDERNARRPRVVRENLYGLTFREVGVLELMANGSSDKEIAKQLNVSVFTVNKHVSKILHKMEAASRTEVGIRALREGLLG